MLIPFAAILIIVLMLLEMMRYAIGGFLNHQIDLGQFKEQLDSIKTMIGP